MAEEYNIDIIKEFATEKEYYYVTTSEDAKKFKVTYAADQFNDMVEYASKHQGEVLTKSQFQAFVETYSDPSYMGVCAICIDGALLKLEKKNIDGIDQNVAYTIAGLVEKGIITFSEGNFMYDHIRDQHRMEYTFEKEYYAITIKLHEKR